MLGKSVSTINRSVAKFINRSPKHPSFLQPLRTLQVHEHICLTLLQQAGIPVPRFGVATTKQEAGEVARRMDTKELLVKAQVLVNDRCTGRFKGQVVSRVRCVHGPEEAESLTEQMLGDHYVTDQTGEEGRLCEKVMVVERMFPHLEYYAAIVMDSRFDGPVLMLSAHGGIPVDEILAQSLRCMFYVPIDIEQGICKESLYPTFEKICLRKNPEGANDILMKMYEFFIQKDVLMLEINPLAEDEEGHFYCLDSRIQFDDNAWFRQKDIHDLKDLSQVDEKEIEASKAHLKYVGLEGDIGCIVNGAGLALATMDIIKVHQGKPANFLDVGPGATAEDVKTAFKIITSDKKVTVVLVNILGGLLHCDIVARGILSALHNLNPDMPVVCRLQGTKEDEAKLLLGTSELNILVTDSLDDAARLAVKVSNIMDLARDTKVTIHFELPI